MNEDALVSKITPAIAEKLILRVEEPPLTVSDDSIIDSVRNGDTEAFGILVKRYEDFVYTLVRGIALSDDLAQDITQEVFLRAYRGIRRFERRANFKTWLYRIAYNTALSHLPKKKIGSISDETIETTLPPRESVDNELQHAMRVLVDRLKPELKAVVLFHYYDDLKYEEIAEILSCPIGTVKVRLFRAKHELKKLWEKYAI